MGSNRTEFLNDEMILEVENMIGKKGEEGAVPRSVSCANGDWANKNWLNIYHIGYGDILGEILEYSRVHVAFFCATCS